MRRWFVLLLIVLLPLRGWVGEVMAGEMLGQQLQTVAAEASSQAAAQAATADHDCAGHGSQSTDDPAPATHDACPTCAACQVCSAVALAFDAVPRVTELHAAAPAAMPRSRFASAEPTAAFKPPIS